MSIHPPNIDGLLCKELRQLMDARGAVLHMLRCDESDFTQFGECYFSEVNPGAVKAWKKHLTQTQNLAVPIGRIRLVIYDDRENSSTQGQLQIFELGRPDAYVRLTIPPQLWYGFGCISPEPALLVNCADTPHQPEESQTRPLHDPSIPYTW